jgi:hypothetical protein
MVVDAALGLASGPGIVLGPTLLRNVGAPHVFDVEPTAVAPDQSASRHAS